MSDLLPVPAPALEPAEPSSAGIAFLRAAEAVIGPARYSATFQGAVEKCALGAQLNREFDRSGEPAETGTAFHEVAAAIGMAARARRRETLEAPAALAIARHVLAHPVPGSPVLGIHQIEDVLALVKGWAPTFVFPVYADVYEQEQLVVHEIDGQRMSAKMDLLAVTGSEADIIDYKSGFNVPTRKEMREDPKRRAALNKYAWHVAVDYPDVEWFHLRLIFPRFQTERSVTIHRSEVDATADLLRIQVARIKKLYQEGLEATGGWHCKLCAAPDLCPKARAVTANPDRGAITSEEQARDAVEEHFAAKAALDQHDGRIKKWLDESGHQFVELAGGEKLGYFGGGDSVQINRRKVEKLGMLPFVGDHRESKPRFEAKSK